jgi:FKBP-type peptidyl-prolyl cis-trans isomerase 2
MSAQTLELVVRFRLYDSHGRLLEESAPHQPMRFVTGRQQILPALEQALAQAVEGEQLSVELGAEQAYGPRRPELVFEVVRDNLPAGMTIQPGMLFNPGGQRGRFQLRVLELTPRGALMDGNHPYAGMDLRFEIEVLALLPHVEADRVAR